MPPIRLTELIQLIFPQGSALADSCAAWAAATPRFAEFLHANNGKIRKKARLSGDEGQQADLRAELAVAAMLLADRRVELVYEPTAASGGRGPDFAVRFRVNTLVYVEVARLRPGSQVSTASRLAGLLSAKARQFQTGASNVLAVVVEEPFGPDQIGQAIAHLRQRAERGERLTHMRDVDPPTLLRLLPRLSAIVTAVSEQSPAVWPHSQARHSLPPDFLQMIRTSALPR